ncbi:spermidine/putrescine import ATP-binding protein PotA [Streptococcus pneumoniae]|nr:spermidine/putrescine import ATP-binding protein PotA [Streptococcus pneumoniae]
MIKFDNIQIKYGDFVAIDNLNLDIHEGEFFTFLGPSGCGKSTTLRALVGFLDPSSGSIEVNGTDVTHLEPEKRGIGIVFQSYALFPTMTVFDNIAFGLKVKKVAPDVIPNHSYLSQLDVTYKTPDLMSHFLPPHEVSFTFCCSSIVFPR